MHIPLSAIGANVIMQDTLLMVSPYGTSNCQLFYVYRIEKAYEVSLLLRELEGGDFVPWTVSRDVLIDCAIHGRTAGEGDFVIEINKDYKMTVSEETLLMHITGHDDNMDDKDTFIHSHAFVVRQPLRDFLTQTLALVPQGEESKHYDIDEWIKELTDADA